MRTPIPEALVRPLHRDLIALLTPEIGEPSARQVSSHVLTVLGLERCDPLYVLRRMLSVCHREEHGSGPEAMEALASVKQQCAEVQQSRVPRPVGRVG